VTERIQGTGERIIREYPNSTRWLEGQRILGVGNLILTTKRLVFLNQVAPSERQVQKLQELSGAPNSRLLNFAIGMHKNNFQIPLSALVHAKLVMSGFLPIPRFCLRLAYHEKGKGSPTKESDFLFTIPLLRGFFQFEISTVYSWVLAIRRALKYGGFTSS